MDIPSSTCLGTLYKKRGKTCAYPTFLMQYHPPFVYLNSPNRRQNLLRSSSTLSYPQPTQCHLTASLAILNYLVVAASFCAMSMPGGQRLPGGGISIPPSNHFLWHRVGFPSCPESVASHRGSLENLIQQSRLDVNMKAGLKKVR